MPSVGIHPDTDLPLTGHETTSGAGEVRTVAAVAADIERHATALEALGVEFARLVRDGSDDPRPGWSARDAAVAAGQLTHAAEVIGTVAHIQADITSCSHDDGVRDTTTWTARHTGISSSTAALQRRVARSIDRYPVLGAAFLDGRVRSHHLAAIDRVIPARWNFEARLHAIGVLTDIQTEIVAVAEDSTQREFERFCQQLRDRFDTDGPQPADGDDRSEIHLRQLPSGRWTLLGDLSDGDGAVLATLLAERVSADIRAERDAPVDDPTDADGRVGGVRPDMPVRMGAALVRLLLDGAAAKKPGRVGLYLHLDLTDLAVMGANVTAHTEANLDITDATLWKLLAGADCTPIITDQGTPLSYGRTRRLAPDILRRALALRHRHCYFHHCDRPPHQQHKHHERWWEHDGLTDPPNLQGDCSEHHHLIHDHGWTITTDDGDPDTVVITRPDGSVLDPAPRWQRARQARDPYRTATLTRLDQLERDLAATRN